MSNEVGDVGSFAGTFLTSRVKDLQNADAAFKRSMHAKSIIRLKPIPLDRLESLNNRNRISLGNERVSQFRTPMVCTADKPILEGPEVHVRKLTHHNQELTYHGHKMGRSTRNLEDHVEESNKISESWANTDWVVSWIDLVKDLNYELRQRHHLHRESRITSTMSELKYVAVRVICVIRIARIKGNAARALVLSHTAKHNLAQKSEELEKRKTPTQVTKISFSRPNKTSVDPTVNFHTEENSLRNFCSTCSSTSTGINSIDSKEELVIAPTIMTSPGRTLKGTGGYYGPLVRRQHLMHKLLYSVGVLEDSMRMMEEAGLFAEDPEQESIKTKLMRYQQFKDFRYFELEKIQELRAREFSVKSEEETMMSTISPGSVFTQLGTHVWQSSEESLSHRVSQIVADRLVYLEARAVQRAKHNTVRYGNFFPTTFTAWRRQLYSIIKFRLWTYKQERIEQWRHIEEAYFNKDANARQEVLMKAGEEPSPQHDVPLPPEPTRKKKRDQTKTDAEKTYVMRKKQKTREKKRKRRVQVAGEGDNHVQSEWGVCHEDGNPPDTENSPETENLPDAEESAVAEEAASYPATPSARASSSAVEEKAPREIVPEEASGAQDQDLVCKEEDVAPENEAEIAQHLRGNLESGQPTESPIPGQEELSISSNTVPSSIKLHDTIHWQDALLLTWGHKWMGDEVVWRDVFKNCNGLNTTVMEDALQSMILARGLETGPHSIIVDICMHIRTCLHIHVLRLLQL